MRFLLARSAAWGPTSGTILVRQGDAAAGVYIVKPGVVRLLHVTSAGLINFLRKLRTPENPNQDILP